MAGNGNSIQDAIREAIREAVRAHVREAIADVVSAELRGALGALGGAQSQEPQEPEPQEPEAKRARARPAGCVYAWPKAGERFGDGLTYTGKHRRRRVASGSVQREAQYTCGQCGTTYWGRLDLTRRMRGKCPGTCGRVERAGLAGEGMAASLLPKVRQVLMQTGGTTTLNAESIAALVGDGVTSRRMARALSWAADNPKATETAYKLRVTRESGRGRLYLVEVLS